MQTAPEFEKAPEFAPGFCISKYSVNLDDSTIKAMISQQANIKGTPIVIRVPIDLENFEIKYKFGDEVFIEGIQYFGNDKKGVPCIIVFNKQVFEHALNELKKRLEIWHTLNGVITITRSEKYVPSKNAMESIRSLQDIEILEARGFNLLPV
jgi:hypothetical protein